MNNNNTNNNNITTTTTTTTTTNNNNNNNNNNNTSDTNIESDIKIGFNKKPNLTKTILKKGKESTNIPEIEKYNEIENEKGISRVKLQFNIISDTIPELDTGNAIIGEDSIKDLVSQEIKMKVMAKKMSGYAESLEIDKQNLLNISEVDNTVIDKINEREKEIEDKMNKINILFKRLFHRREKLSNMPIVWVK